jgi:hypothetical protein
MFFINFGNEKDKSAISTKPSTTERAPRYGSLAMVSIDGYEGMALLRNVSYSGFRMESKTFVEMEVGTIHTMRITPEPLSGIKQFEIKVEVRWVQSLPEKFMAGFMLTQGGNRSFDRYVDFLKGQGISGNRSA